MDAIHSPRSDIVPILVVVGFQFNDEFDMVHPCFVETKVKGKCVRYCYFRGSKPELFDVIDRNQKGTMTVSLIPAGKFADK